MHAPRLCWTDHPCTARLLRRVRQHVPPTCWPGTIKNMMTKETKQEKYVIFVLVLPVPASAPFFLFFGRQMAQLGSLEVSVYTLEAGSILVSSQKGWEGKEVCTQR